MTTSPLSVPVALGPLPDGDPRDWLTAAVLDHTQGPPPTQIIAAQGGQQRVAIDPSPDAAWIAAVDAALLAEGVAWVGGIGSALLKKDGGQLLASFARIRWPDGRVWLRVWLRLPGIPLTPEGAETHDTLPEGLPTWLQRLFPAPRGLDVTLTEAQWSDLAWLRRAGVRAPDEILPLPAGAALRDFALVAAHRLEARVVHTRQVGPSTAAWLSEQEGVALWWGEDLASARRIGERLARAGAWGCGLFGLGQDEHTQQHLIGLAVEGVGAERLLWVRRFRVVEGGTAQWLDESGFFRDDAPSLGWFSAR